MKKIVGLVALSAVFMLSGCVVRTYEMTRDRIDQDLSAGNRGYLKGEAPQGETGKVKTGTRTTQVVEVELGLPFKSKKAKPAQESVPQQQNISESIQEKDNLPDEVMENLPAGGYREYKVTKDDTLQKISQKFYGTTKKWMMLYNTNKDVLKSPDKLRAGQVIKVPEQAMKETKENLK